MIEPAPDETTLSLAFEAALRAPDHGQLRPYRFFLVRGQARHALGDLMAKHLAESDPTAGLEQLAKMRQKPLRAPLIVVVAAKLVDHPKVPRIEQVVGAGAAAQNILLCLHARGYAGIWRTGGAAYSDSIKASFGLAQAGATQYPARAPHRSRHRVERLATWSRRMHSRATRSGWPTPTKH